MIAGNLDLKGQIRVQKVASSTYLEQKCGCFIIYFHDSRGADDRMLKRHKKIVWLTCYFENAEIKKVIDKIASSKIPLYSP